MSGEAPVLFVFAHQDDEIPVLPRIAYEVARGNRVRCVYLTDGAAGVAADVRDDESRRMLARIGVAEENVVFLGGEHRIRDGRLAFETAAAVELLRDDARAAPIPARVYTLDWEGGHPDHDACHLVALALARELGIRTCLAYSLYNGFRRPRGFFRVTSLVPAAGLVERRRLSWKEALLAVRALPHYPSQRKTWLGLGPGLAVRSLMQREERFRHADVARLASPPHARALLYESMFHVSARAVLEATAELRAALAESESVPR